MMHFYTFQKYQIKYIDDPSKVLSVGQIIKVKIKDVDKIEEE